MRVVPILSVTGMIPSGYGTNFTVEPRTELSKFDQAPSFFGWMCISIRLGSDRLCLAAHFKPSERIEDRSSPRLRFVVATILRIPVSTLASARHSGSLSVFLTLLIDRRLNIHGSAARDVEDRREAVAADQVCRELLLATRRNQRRVANDADLQAHRVQRR